MATSVDNGGYSFEQAKKWSISTVKRRKSGIPIVSCFEFDENDFSNLNAVY